jgi:hypothetical protein
MKAITILQPWANLIANGAKKIETRSWATKYRGEIAIHAGLGHQGMKLFMSTPELKKLLPFVGFYPYGAVIAIAELADCLKIINGNRLDGAPFYEEQFEIAKREIPFGDYTPGRYAWILANVRRIAPVPAKGMQRIWNWEGM